MLSAIQKVHPLTLMVIASLICVLSIPIVNFVKYGELTFSENNGFKTTGYFELHDSHPNRTINSTWHDGEGEEIYKRVAMKDMNGGLLKENNIIINYKKPNETRNWAVKTNATYHSPTVRIVPKHENEFIVCSEYGAIEYSKCYNNTFGGRLCDLNHSNCEDIDINGTLCVGEPTKCIEWDTWRIEGSSR